jgi:hypothetical protein
MVMSDIYNILINKVDTLLKFITLALLAIIIIEIRGGDRTLLITGMCIVFLLTLLVVFLRLFKPSVLSSPILVLKNGSVTSNDQVEPALIFANSQNAKFIQHFEELIANANSIILIGTGIKILHQEPLVEQLMNRIKQDANFQLEIYAANPFSIAVENRLIEEETGAIIPTIGKSGLIKWLTMLLKKQEKLGNPTNLFIKLFSHYPTFAVFIINGKEFLFYPYGYAHLGTLSPVVKFSKDNKEHEFIIEFLEEQYNRVKDSAVDAQLIFDIRDNKVSLEKLNPFAIYFVPDSKTSLYKFGSKVLGYDIYKKTPIDTVWADYVGVAANFGFHLTIADALYCISRKELEVIAKEVNIVVEDFKPFTLSFEIQKNFPDKHSISLVCNDESGTLEALHFEMICRCYKKAAASNYSLELAKADRDNDIARANLMIKHYKAPYILTRFKPHFTLLTKVPSEKMENIFNELKKLYEEQVENNQIEIDAVAFMLKSDGEQTWEIDKKFKLKDYLG